MQKYLLIIATVLVHVCCDNKSINEQYESLLHILKCDYRKDLNLDVSAVKLLFYNGTEKEERYPINEAAHRILEKNLNFANTWIVYVPGFNSSPYEKYAASLMKALKNLRNTYLIVVDHTAYTTAGLNYKRSYEKSVKYAYYIGIALSKFLVKLHEGGVSEKNIKLIGHSLGGQMIGFTGFDFQKSTGCSLNRITGLDPAGPCYSNKPVEEQLRKGAAKYVDVFHCNAGFFGTYRILGDADYFANDNRRVQPGCELIEIVLLTCSHEKCVNYYADTVNDKYLYEADKCDSYEDFENDNCYGEGLGGYWNKYGDNGTYYFSTKQ